MNYKSSSQLKALSREQLKGRYAVAVGATFLTSLISVVVSLLITIFARTDSTASIIIYYLISFIVSLLTAVLGIGLVKFFLKLVKNEAYRISDIFWGFQNHPDKVIVITILLTLIFFICLLPGVGLLYVYLVTYSRAVFVLSMFALMMGIVVMIVVGITYSQVGCIISDNSEYSILEIMKTSSEMMKGQKGRFFYLQISFIGWYLLSFLSCGIALLWIEPYRLCTNVYFYIDLKGDTKPVVIDEYI